MNFMQVEVQSLQINLPQSQAAAIEDASVGVETESDKFPLVFQDRISETSSINSQVIENNQLIVELGIDAAIPVTSTVVDTPPEFWLEHLENGELTITNNPGWIVGPMTEQAIPTENLQSDPVLDVEPISNVMAAPIPLDGEKLPVDGEELPVSGNKLPTAVAINEVLRSRDWSGISENRGIQKNLLVDSDSLPNDNEEVIPENIRADKNRLDLAPKLPVSSLPEIESRTQAEKFSDSIIAKFQGPQNTPNPVIDPGGFRTQPGIATMGNNSNLQPGLPTPSGLEQLSIMKPDSASEWGRGLGDRVSWMINQKLNTASIRLDPPLLGKLEISIQVRDDVTSITINTQHAQTREMIENASHRLRDHLQEAGFQNVNVDVSNDHKQNQPGADHPADSSRPATDEAEIGEQAINDIDQQKSGYYSSDSLVDYFA